MLWEGKKYLKVFRYRKTCETDFVLNPKSILSERMNLLCCVLGPHGDSQSYWVWESWYRSEGNKGSFVLIAFEAVFFTRMGKITWGKYMEQMYDICQQKAICWKLYGEIIINPQGIGSAAREELYMHLSISTNNYICIYLHIYLHI